MATGTRMGPAKCVCVSECVSVCVCISILHYHSLMMESHRGHWIWLCIVSRGEYLKNMYKFC